MSLAQQDEILVWTSDGYEGRFLKWDDHQWRAFEYRNYRHWFSPSQQPTDIDIRALRRSYNLSVQVLSDEDLLRTSPVTLEALRSEIPLSRAKVAGQRE